MPRRHFPQRLSGVFGPAPGEEPGERSNARPAPMSSVFDAPEGSPPGSVPPSPQFRVHSEPTERRRPRPVLTPQFDPVQAADEAQSPLLARTTEAPGSPAPPTSAATFAPAAPTELAWSPARRRPSAPPRPRSRATPTSPRSPRPESTPSREPEAEPAVARDVLRSPPCARAHTPQSPLASSGSLGRSLAASRLLQTAAGAVSSPAQLNAASAADRCSEQHAAMGAVLTHRAQRLREARELWRAGEHAALCRSLAGDASLTVDVLNAVTPQRAVLDLPLCAGLLPLAAELLESKFEDYVVCALTALNALVRAAAPAVKASHTWASMIDTQATHAQACFAHISALAESSVLEVLGRRRGGVGHLVSELLASVRGVTVVVSRFQ